MEFAILGSLEVRAGGRVVDLGGAVQRRMLAALLLRPNRVVTIERLVEVGWDGAPPSTAERQVRNRVAALRSILTRHDDLAGLVAAHPLRERLVGRLMTVLAAAGRQDEALAAYDRLADRLADRLGIDPSPELRALRVRLLGGPPEPDVPTPQQLPADVTGFTGRVEDLDRLDRMLSDAQADHAVVISAIAGTAGVGKTALMPRVRLPIDPPAAGVVPVPMPDRETATAWVDAECAVLVATAQLAYEVGADLRAQQLTSMVETELDMFGYWPELRAMGRAALAAAERSGYQLGLGYAHIALGIVADRLGEIDDNIRHVTSAMEAFENAGDRTCVMFALRNLAAATTVHRSPRDAIPLIERAYDLAVELGRPNWTGRVRNLMAEIREAAGDHEQALVDSQAAMALLLDDPAPNLHVVGDAWLVRGGILDSLGRHDEGRECFRRGLELAETTSSRRYVAVAHEYLGDNSYATEHLDAARESWRVALEIFEELGAAPNVARVRAKLIGSEAG